MKIWKEFWIRIRNRIREFRIREFRIRKDSDSNLKINRENGRSKIVRHWWISNFFKRNHISKERNIQYFLFLCSGSSPVPSSKAKTDRQNCSIIQYCFCLQSISYSKNIFLKAAIFLRIILLRIAYQHGRPFNSKTLYKSIGLI